MLKNVHAFVTSYLLSFLDVLLILDLDEELNVLLLSDVVFEISLLSVVERLIH
jgi:hypothetical protein